MRLLITTLVVTAVWMFLAAVLKGCPGHQAAGLPPTDNVFTGEVWLWEQDNGRIQLREDAALPLSHPLSRVAGSGS